MATNSVLIKIIVIYFAINAVLFAGGVRWSDSNVFGNLVTSTNSSATITDNTVQYGVGTIGGENPNVNQDSGSSALNFIDVLSAVRTFINFIVVMFGGIFIVFLMFPAVVQLFIGVPMGILALVGLIYFTRSGQ